MSTRTRRLITALLATGAMVLFAIFFAVSATHHDLWAIGLSATSTATWFYLAVCAWMEVYRS